MRRIYPPTQKKLVLLNLFSLRIYLNVSTNKLQRFEEKKKRKKRPQLREESQ